MTHKLLILSDSHLFASRDRQLFGVNTYDSLLKVINHIKALRQKYDLVITSGDISEDGDSRAYEDFHKLTSGLATSAIWMKGNHDQFDNVPLRLAKSFIHTEWHMEPWSLIFLDSSMTGKDEGKLSQRELDRLELFLQKYSQNPVMIFLHHQPVDIGSEFIDVLGLKNKHTLLDLISSYGNIQGVFFGHVHQQYDGNVNGMCLHSIPSTSMQFKPHASKLSFDILTPGYLTLNLYQDGTYDTKIQRIASEK